MLSMLRYARMLPHVMYVTDGGCPVQQAICNRLKNTLVIDLDDLANVRLPTI